MTDQFIPGTMAQCNAINYQEILDTDSRIVPDALRERVVPDLGTAPVSINRYIDQEFFDRSIEKMWLKTWQMACREEEIPIVGDFTLYEIVGKSLIIVRSGPNEFKALHNSCRHRGRKLVTQSGHNAKFRCPFHGFTWKNDGSFLFNPVQWDFPQCPPESFGLPEARLGRWGGFIFINFDKEAPPLEKVLAPIPRHFERWAFEDKYIAARVAKSTKANWNLNVEAFLEAYHSAATHPQIMPFVADANAQNDVFSPHVTRHIDARGVQSPLARREYTQDEIADAMLAPGSRIRAQLGDGVDVRVPAGMTARSYAASLVRSMLEAETGYDHNTAADCEVSDALLYNLFPNTIISGGFANNYVFRWRPVGRQHDQSVMEIYVLKTVPKDQPRPRPASLHFLESDEPWAAATELGGLGPVLDQDWSNMEQVQAGLMASDTKVVNLGHYLEIAIRRHQMTLDQYMEGVDPS